MPGVASPNAIPVMAKKLTKWFVIADGARARILAHEGAEGPLELVMDREHEASRERTRELGSDRPGRSFERWTSARHGMEPPADWHRFEKRKFVENLAEILDDACTRQQFDHLVLVAPPRILGFLRKALAEATKGKVTAEIPKDLTTVPLHELPDRLREYL